MSLSIIIPVYNEVKQLKVTIKKLPKLKKFFKNFEIVFVDDFSNDETFNFLKKVSCQKKFIKVIKNIKVILVILIRNKNITQVNREATVPGAYFIFPTIKNVRNNKLNFLTIIHNR